MALQLPTGVETAADLELTDRRLYFYGGCRISQVDLRDVGLVGIGKLPERSGLEVLVAGEEQELETDEATAEACRQLGLPVAFASSGQVQMTSQNTSLQSPLSEGGESRVSDRQQEDQRVDNDSREALCHQADMPGQCSYSNQAGAGQAASQAGWQQAWDHSWSCWYYYNEALQVTQWEPPDAPIQPYTSELPLSPVSPAASPTHHQHAAGPFTSDASLGSSDMTGSFAQAHNTDIPACVATRPMDNSHPGPCSDPAPDAATHQGAKASVETAGVDSCSQQAGGIHSGAPSDKARCSPTDQATAWQAPSPADNIVSTDQLLKVHGNGSQDPAQAFCSCASGKVVSATEPGHKGSPNSLLPAQALLPSSRRSRRAAARAQQVVREEEGAALQGITQHTLPSQDAHSPGGNAAAGAARKALPRRLARFWFQRYSLWSRFDDGILMDEAGWFSVTPEVLAAHHAHQCSSIFVDGFAGVGGNAIQAALAGFQVVAVDMDAARLELVAHNALLYGVQHCIELLCADFFEVAPRLQADVVFLSPPWGGLAYRDKTCFHVQEEFGGLGMGLSCLLTVATQALPTRTVYEDPTAALQSKMQSKSSTGVVACFLPRHSSLPEIAQCIPSSRSCIVERNYLNEQLKAITLYLVCGEDRQFDACGA
ncbi:hypothetical protein WJX74_000244 [Apatococcus lobatus]|uniref:Trimethylguanosine synthase n=1 Tax=Apatococcus lobatus TaxID=904363 RepID=A0AAW1S0M7_9CHLO